MTMKFFLFMMSASALAMIAGCSGEENANRSETGTATTSSSKPEISTEALKNLTAEDIIRQFVLAAISKDKKMLEAVAVPHDDLHLLLSGDDITPQQMELAREQIANMPFRTLAEGDTFRLPSGNQVKVDASMVGDDRQLLTSPENPFPYVLVRQGDGQWRVDPETFIVVRKIAQAKMKGKTPDLPNRPPHQ